MKNPAFKFSSYTLVYLLFLLLVSCSSPKNTTESVSQTISTNTHTVNMVDLSNLSPTNTVVPLPSDTPAIKKQTSTIIPTENHIETPATLTPTNTCTNKAKFIRNLTLNDYVSLTPGKLYTKVWEVMNTGTCTWTPEYIVLFDSGDPFFNTSDIHIPSEVKPGETVEIRYNFYAPSEVNIYEGFWILQDSQQNSFGLGDNSNEKLHFIFMIEKKINPTPP